MWTRHQRTLYHSGGRGRRGAILLIVLAITLGLVTISLYFADTMVLEYKASDNGTAGAEAQQAVDGARRYVAYLLRNLETPGQLPDLENYPAEAVPLGMDAQYWLIGRDPNNSTGSGSVVGGSIGGMMSGPRMQMMDMPTFGLVDEASKINLNTITTTQTIALLEMLPNMTPELAAAIVDWRDEDDELTDAGAESETYMMFNPPYAAKNADFDSPEELRLVSGMDYFLLYGEDANRNGVLDANENDGSDSPPDDDMDGQLDPGFIEYFTVWSREPNKGTDITSGTQGLTQLFNETLGETRGQEIGQALQGRRVQSPLELYKVLATNAKLTADEWGQVEGSLAVGKEPFRRGLINVATASQVVLTCIPGIGEENASKIVAARQGKTMADLATLSWVGDVLDEEAATQAGPYITVKSYQFSADVAAVGHQGRGMRRSLYVFDTADGTPRVVYQRDLSRMGWPLGRQLREEMRMAAKNGDNLGGGLFGGGLPGGRR